MKYVEIILIMLTIGVITAHLRIDKLIHSFCDVLDRLEIVANKIKKHFHKTLDELNKQNDDKEWFK